MIAGSAAWENALAADQKKPLYYLVIDDVLLYVMSFVPADENVATAGGYGTAYGTAYGDD